VSSQSDIEGNLTKGWITYEVVSLAILIG